MKKGQGPNNRIKPTIQRWSNNHFFKIYSVTKTTTIVKHVEYMIKMGV